MEKNFYYNLGSVFNKSLQLAFYNTLRNDPGFIQKDIENIKAVSLADVQRVYNTYIKGRPFVATSFIPKGNPEMMAENSILAAVSEEKIEEATQVEIAEAGKDVIVKTQSAIDRSKEPSPAKDPEVNIPVIWKAELANGVNVYGIENKELPLVNMDLVVDGGIYQDHIDMPGVANMLAEVMPQGTQRKTPEQLEEEIMLLGSSIDMYATKGEIVMNADMLSRNFEKTFSLMTEILLEPRWDMEEFELARTKTLNTILQNMVQPRAVADGKFHKLLYGDLHIFGFSGKGTKESISKLTVDDLKHYYEKNFSPSVATILIVGNITKERALTALKSLESKWAKHEVQRNDYRLPSANGKSQLYFVDIPGSKQSVINVGYLALSRNNPEYVKADFANYRLGGAFTSIVNQILREEKGYTYGAFSSFREQKVTAPFLVSTSVRSDATLESLRIIRESLQQYADSISDGDLQFTKDCLIKSNALRFETIGSQVSMLRTMSKYGFGDDFVKQEEEIIKNMTLEEYRNIARKYMECDSMIFLVVGDAATQMKSLEKLGIGKPVLLMQ